MDPFDLIGQRLENFSSIYDDDGPSTTVQESRPMFQFGGGADAQKMGTEASRVFFKNRSVDKPTPTFEGGTGKAKVTNAKFKNPTQEKEYIKILEDRFKFPKGSKEARKVASNADISKKFGISLNNVERVNKALINKLDLKYPTQTYEGYEKIQRDRDKIRKENIKKTSSTGVESKIKRDIKKVDPTALANDVDIAHRASLKANANIGSKYLVSSLGLDSKVVNQSIVKPIEQKLGTLYELQKKLIKGLEPGNISKEKQLQIEKLNKKISELADRTKGTLQGVLIDEKTLKPVIYGVDYSKTLGFGLVNKPVSELTQADRDLIKLNIGEQIKAAKLDKGQQIRLAKIGCPGKANGGRIGFDQGLNVTACATKGIEKLQGDPSKLTPGDKANVTAITKTIQGGRFLKNMLGPTALAYEALFAAPFAAYEYAKGANKDEIISNATYGLFGKSEEEQLKEKYADYGKAQKLKDTYDDSLRAENLSTQGGGYRTQAMNKLKAEDLNKKALEQSKTFNTTLPPSMGFKGDFDLDMFFNAQALDQKRREEFAKEKEQRSKEIGILKPSTGLEAIELAGGGIAKEAGDRSGPPPESGPTPQGLQGLFNRVKKI